MMNLPCPNIHTNVFQKEIKETSLFQTNFHKSELFVPMKIIWDEVTIPETWKIPQKKVAKIPQFISPSIISRDD